MTIAPKKSKLRVEEKAEIGKVPTEADTKQREGEYIMAKKITTPVSADIAATSEQGENVQTPAVETPKFLTVKVLVDGKYVDAQIPVSDAPDIDKMLSADPAVKAEKLARQRAKIAADQKAKRDAEREARKNDPEWLAKDAEKQAKRDANKAKLADRDTNRARRDEKKEAIKNQKIEFLTESGSSLPLDRLVEAKITKKYMHGMKDEGVQRGWRWVVVYTTKSKKTVTVDETIDLDKEGVGTLETAYADAKKAILETLAELS